jgi:hypothetical protein
VIWQSTRYLYAKLAGHLNFTTVGAQHPFSGSRPNELYPQFKIADRHETKGALTDSRLMHLKGRRLPQIEVRINTLLHLRSAESRTSEQPPWWSPMAVAEKVRARWSRGSSRGRSCRWYWPRSASRWCCRARWRTPTIRRGRPGDGDRLAHRRPPCRARHLRPPPRLPCPPIRVRDRDPRPGPQCQVRVSELISVQSQARLLMLH